MYVEILGWVGTVLSLSFYILLAMRYMHASYAVGILGAIVWAVVGYMTGLHPLVWKYVIVIGFLLWGWYQWKEYGRRLKNRYYCAIQDGKMVVKEVKTREERKEVLESEFGVHFFRSMENAKEQARLHNNDPREKD